MKIQQKKAVVTTLIVVSAIISLLTIFPLVRCQSSVLYSDDFDFSQPNLQFILGSNDTITNVDYSSPTHSLQVSPNSSSYSYALFNDTTGSLYVQLLYKTNATSENHGGIITLFGSTGWLSLYQQQPTDGLTLDWDYGYNATNIFLTPNSWYNITLFASLDPNNGTNSYALLWLNDSLVLSQQMYQVDGYELNQIVFNPSSNPAANNYDDVIISTQPISVPSPTPTPTPSPSPSPTVTASPTPTPTPTDSPTPTPTLTPAATPITQPSLAPTSTPKPSSNPTIRPTSNPTSTDPSTNPTIPEIPFILAISIVLMITMLIIVSYRKHYACCKLSFWTH